MIRATLTRTETGDLGTFGSLEFDGFKCVTGELPERGNAQMISCIPAGVYTCKITHSTRHNRDMYEIMDVPGRTGVRFDVANLMGDEAKGYEAEVDGCVALGRSRGLVRGQAGITGSQAAVDEFNVFLHGQDFELTIINKYVGDFDGTGPGPAEA